MISSYLKWMHGRGNWFQTYQGFKFHVIDPHIGDVDIDDIAHALSFTCRYGGHCREFYSVAQHSIYVEQMLSERWPDTPLLSLQGLLHDAAEAYVGDMKRPIKDHMPTFQAIESNVNKVIHEALGVPLPSEHWERLIKYADNAVLMAERRDIMNHFNQDWDIKEEPWWGRIQPWPHPDDGYMNFILKWRELKQCLG